MRITQEFAERLAKTLTTRALKTEEGAIDAAKKLLGPKLLNHIYGGQRAIIEALPKGWFQRVNRLTFELRHADRHTHIHFEFAEKVLVPPHNWSQLEIDLDNDPDLKDEFIGLAARIRAHLSSTNDLARELYNNILAAKSTKKLIAAWPDAAEDIVALEAFYTGADIEVPLEGIMARYNRSLPSPAEIIVEA